MFLFFISLAMVVISSYLLASVFASKRYMTCFMYFLIIAFAQVVLNIELLSLINSISKIGILALNVIFTVLSVLYWQKKQCPIYKPQFKEFWHKVFKAIRKDKMLAVMGFGFLFFILISIFLCIIMPVNSYDALSYHLNRALVWVSQGNLNHFDIADDRNVNMAINSELLYTWFLAFVPKSTLLGFFSFLGYLLTIAGLYSILELSGYCMRKRLWAIFLMSSFAGVITEASGVETNIIISGLTLATVALFFQGAKTNKLTPIVFSGLTLAIAVGTKTTAFFMAPGIALLFLFFLLAYRKEQFWRYSKYFIVSFLICSVVFSAYNYVLNFLDFGNPTGSVEAHLYHDMKGGIKGYISGVIHHLVLLLDFSGFTYGTMIQKYVFNMQNVLLNSLNIPLDLNVISSNSDELNWQLVDACIGGGVVSVLVLLPCTIIAMVRGLFDRKHRKRTMLSLFGLSLFLSIFVMSGIIGFMLYSSRFLVTFLAFSAPVLVISYIRSNKNFFKYVILFYVMSYFLLIATHISSRHFTNIIKRMSKGATISEIRTLHLCTVIIGYEGRMPFCDLRSVLYKVAPKGSRIGLFSSSSDNVAVIKFMENDGYKVDYLLVPNYNNYDLSNYDYLVFTSDNIYSNSTKHAEWVLDSYEVKDQRLVFKNEQEKPRCLLMNDVNNKIYLIDKKNDKGLVPNTITCAVPEPLLDRDGFVKVARIVARSGKTNADVEMGIYENQARASKELQ